MLRIYMAKKIYRGFAIISETRIGLTAVYYRDGRERLYRKNIKDKKLLDGTPILDSGEWLDNSVDFEAIASKALAAENKYRASIG